MSVFWYLRIFTGYLRVIYRKINLWALVRRFLTCQKIYLCELLQVATSYFRMLANDYELAIREDSYGRSMHVKGVLLGVFLLRVEVLFIFTNIFLFYLFMDTCRASWMKGWCLAIKIMSVTVVESHTPNFSKGKIVHVVPTFGIVQSHNAPVLCPTMCTFRLWMDMALLHCGICKIGLLFATLLATMEFVHFWSNSSLGTRASIYWADERLTARSREVSKPWDVGLDFSNRPEIWQVPRQHRCRITSQNFRAIRSSWDPNSRLRDFTRFGSKTPVRLVNRGLDKWWLIESSASDCSENIVLGTCFCDL